MMNNDKTTQLLNDRNTYLVSYHGEPNEYVKSIAHKSEVSSMMTDVVGYTKFDGAMYEIFKSHTINCGNFLNEIDTQRFYNHKAVVCATNDAFYVRRFLDDPPKDIMPGVVYFEKAFCSRNIHYYYQTESFILDYTTIFAEFGTLMKLLSLSHLMEYDINSVDVAARLEPSLLDERLLRRWIYDLGLTIKVNKIIEIDHENYR